MKTNKTYKKLTSIVSLVLVVTMVMMLSTPVYANNSLENSLTSWIIGDVDGYKSNTSEISEFFSESPQLTLSSANTIESNLLGYNISNQAFLTDLILAYNAGHVEINGTLVLNGSSYPLNSVGDYYRNETTERSAEADNLILCEFEDTDEIHFVQFRIDKAVPQITNSRQPNVSLVTIILQLVNTGNLIQFQQGIDASLFDELYELESNIQLEGEELDNKIISLYSVRNNLLDVPIDSAMQETSEFFTQSTDVQMSTASASITGWRYLIDALNSYGSVNLNNYGNIVDTSFFTGGGWKFENGWDNGVGYSLSSYSIANGSNEYLTQFSLLDCSTQSYSYNSNDIWHTGMQMDYYGGLIVSYTPSNGNLSVDYYNYGIRHNDVELTINKLTNSAFFINRSVGRLYEASGNIVRAALVVVPYFSTIADVFDHAYEMNQTVGSGPALFPDTYLGQVQLYGSDKIIRGLYVTTTSSNWLKSSGHYINVEGNIKFNTSTNWDYRYRYTSYHNL
jgi:hypothetical protein